MTRLFIFVLVASSSAFVFPEPRHPRATASSPRSHRAPLRTAAVAYRSQPCTLHHAAACPEDRSAADPDQERGSTTDAAAILAGTAIGGGFLALPSVTSPLGFAPSVVALSGMWLLLALAGIAYAEATARALDGNEGGPPASVFSITRLTFGGAASTACSLAFLAQMIAVITAQCVKAAQFLEVTAGLPYLLGCALPSLAIGLFTFLAR